MYPDYPNPWCLELIFDRGSEVQNQGLSKTFLQQQEKDIAYRVKHAWTSKIFSISPTRKLIDLRVLNFGGTWSLTEAQKARLKVC